jgi:hypothetical protein
MWWDYVAKKVDKFVNNFVETLGVASATAVVGAMLVVPFSLSSLGAAANRLLAAVTHWLSALTIPF